MGDGRSDATESYHRPIPIPRSGRRPHHRWRSARPARGRRRTTTRRAVAVGTWVGLAMAIGPGAGPAWAHGATASTADSLSELLLIGSLGVMAWFFHLRRRVLRASRRRANWALFPLALAGVTLALTAGSWAPRAKPAKNRPVTVARLQIIDPTPGEVTGADLTVRLNLIGGSIAPLGSTRLAPNEGHVHLYVDARLVSMTYGLTEDLHGLAAGPHSVRAEFVAADHGSFKNPVVAAVAFQVGS